MPSYNFVATLHRNSLVWPHYGLALPTITQVKLVRGRLSFPRGVELCSPLQYPLPFTPLSPIPKTVPSYTSVMTYAISICKYLQWNRTILEQDFWNRIGWRIEARSQNYKLTFHWHWAVCVDQQLSEVLLSLHSIFIGNMGVTIFSLKKSYLLHLYCQNLWKTRILSITAPQNITYTRQFNNNHFFLISKLC